MQRHTESLSRTHSNTPYRYHRFLLLLLLRIVCCIHLSIMSEAKTIETTTNAAADTNSHSQSASDKETDSSNSCDIAVGIGIDSLPTDTVTVTHAQLSDEWSPKVRVGVGVLLMNASGQVLLGERKNSHGHGAYALPGGHLEVGESWAQCAVREVHEECDIKLALENVTFAAVTNDIMTVDKKHYVTIFMKAVLTDATVQPKNMEPHKCAGWKFYDWHQMPSPRFLPLQHLIDSGFQPL
jgi:8-oxo-dGTP diphosphatase